MRYCILATLALAPLAVAQPITPYSLWELEPTHADLRAQPSSTDLVQGFPESVIPGILSDQVINESKNSGTFGFIDPNNGVTSHHMYTSDDCLQINYSDDSDGFHDCCGGNPGQLNNGMINGPIDGVLRDFARAALVLRFGFSSPTDIGALRVIGGNLNDPDGRTFHHYDVWASTDGLGDFGRYHLIARGVRSGEFGMVNDFTWHASLTELHDFDSKYLAEDVTDLRLVFYCVSNTGIGRLFLDPWQGYFAEEPDYVTSCSASEPAEPMDVDGRRKAFEASVLQEIDVFAPGEITPWGDIDYDTDLDIIDAARLQLCYDGSTTSNGCFRYDLTEDGTVAFDDAEMFVGMMTGPN